MAGMTMTTASPSTDEGSATLGDFRRVEVECAAGDGRKAFGIAQAGVVLVRGRCEACVESMEREDGERERVKLLDLLTQGTKIPKRMRAWSLATYPDDAAGRAAKRVAGAWLREYRAGVPRNLILHGPVGGGKTGLAWGIGRELVEVDLVEVLFLNFRELLAQLRRSFDADGRRPSEYVRASRVPVLILDDLGAERPTEWAREELANLVDRRYGNELPTIFTSNYSMDDLGRRLGRDDPVEGKRVVSRIVDGATKHEVKAKDRRAAAA